MKSGRVIILIAITGHGEERVVDVGRVGAALDVDPVVILH
jgi:hypothetical protein